MITTEAGNFISYGEVKEALGLDEGQLDRMLKEMKPPVYPQVLYGEKYVRQEIYTEIEAEYLMQCHKKATYRQAIGIIGKWDCRFGDNQEEASNHAIAAKWSQFLNRKMTPADVADLIYIFVTTREEKQIQYRRPTDVDFMHIAYRWSLHTGIKLNGDDAEKLLSIFVENKDFFEPLPMGVARAIIKP